MQSHPQLGEYDDTPIYNTQAVVRMTHVQAPRLRAWERRYTLLSPQRNANSYRLYSERDVAIILWLRDQVAAGMTISQATAYLRDALREPVVNETHALLPNSNLQVLTTALVGAAKRLQEDQSNELLRQAFAIYPVEEVCLNLIVPVMVEIGCCWQSDEQMIIVEHFFSGVVRAQIDTLWHGTYNPTNGPHIIVGTAPDEQHELGALMLALFLRRAGVRVTYLGRNIPVGALVRMAQTIHPAALCLSVTLPDRLPSILAVARDLAAVAGLEVYLGGQALTPEVVASLPSHVQYIGKDSLQAVATIKKAFLAV